MEQNYFSLLIEELKVFDVIKIFSCCSSRPSQPKLPKNLKCGMTNQYDINPSPDLFLLTMVDKPICFHFQCKVGIF